MTLLEQGAYLLNGTEVVLAGVNATDEIKQKTGKTVTAVEAAKGTIAYGIIQEHNAQGDEENLRLRYDSLTSHDITYVGIIQTARASGMEKFPMPYVLTNCHNSLCAVGGTINEDDHMFALSAAKKYGGIYVPPHLAVIHSFNREVMAGCGRMILGSDSHTRYGALGTMAVGEGGGELAKQLVGRTYDVTRPPVVGVYLTGAPKPGVGPHDVALSLVGATYGNGFVKNSVMEFVGPGVESLPVEFRNAVDCMTTETTCWSSIWKTDGKVKEYFDIHARPAAYKELNPADVAFYDRMILVDLAEIEPTIAMPFHPSNTYTIAELKANAKDILYKVQQDCLATFDTPGLTMDLVGKVRGNDIFVDQGIVAGCAGGTFDNVCDVADILNGQSVGNDTFRLSVYPGSQPAYLELVKNGAVAKIMEAGGIVRSAFCGPCFGAGDTPANGEFSIRHTTRNFPNREGSKPGEGQLSSVALMDARSIAATAINGGKLTAATDLDVQYTGPKFHFDKSVYEKRVLNCAGKADTSVELKFGPNIKDWPTIPALTDNLLVKVVSYITDPVTTTDELIPSGETSAFRSNPLRLAEFTLSRKDPAYVGEAKAVHEVELAREAGEDVMANAEAAAVYAKLAEAGLEGIDPAAVGIGSAIYAHKPGDGSAREQAASCQRVLGGWANIAQEYATKRYRSNLLNWGMVPFLTKDSKKLAKGDYVFVPDIRAAVLENREEIPAYVVGETVEKIVLSTAGLTQDEREILVAGCLINYYKDK